MTENRPGNSTANSTMGSSPNDWYPRVTGDFTGTTDEIIQWAACKWGMDVDWARAQAAIESWWDHNTNGDNGESFGILQVRRPFHQSAFEDENAVRSTAYNADYTFENWRRCFEGHNDYAWLNTVERGREYAAGDGLGCMGVWFSGRWYTDAAVGYMNRVTDYHSRRIWTTDIFGPAQPDGAGFAATRPTVFRPAATGCYLYKSTYSASARCRSGRYAVGITYYCDGVLRLRNGAWRTSWDPASVAGVPIECAGQPTVRSAWIAHG